MLCMPYSSQPQASPTVTTAWIELDVIWEAHELKIGSAPARSAELSSHCTFSSL